MKHAMEPARFAPAPAWVEAERLSALRSYGILDMPPEAVFDEIARVAALVCKAPIAVVNLIEDTRQFFMAEIGLGVRETPIDVSICAHAILQHNIFVVPDTTKDPRFNCNPLVAGDPYLRFYAGALLETPAGLPLGTVCVLDYEPRPEGITREQGETLRALARAAMAQLELRRSSRALAEGEAKFRAITASIDQMIWSTRPDGYHDFYNERWYEFTGVPQGSTDGEEWSEMFHPEDQERAWSTWERSLATGEPYHIEYRLRHRSGQYRWVLGRAQPMRSSDGQVTRWFGTCTDIHDRKEAEENLRRSEALKAAILNAALDCIITIDENSRVLEWNAAAERAFGHTRDEVLGRDLTDIIIPPEYRDAHRRGMAHYLATGHGPVLKSRIEITAMRADGSLFPVELAINAIHIDEKPLFTAYLRDITDRKRAEEAERQSQQRLQATYEHAFAGIAEVDRGGRLLRVNEQFCSITGYDRDEILERTIWDITHPDDRAGDLEQFNRQMAGDLGAYTLEKRYLHKAGHPVWVELSASKVDDANGQPLYGVRVARDVTERRRAEKHQRLLLNELNHRVKNTLATVQSIASQTLRNAASIPDARISIEQRLIALSRAHDVLTLESWEGADLCEIVRQAIEPFNSDTEQRFYSSGPQVRLSPRMALAIAMAFQELLTNAIKYGALSSAEGEVHITWSVEDTPKRDRLQFRWEEKGGPPVLPPTRKGFGMRLIERSLAQDLNGEVRIEYNPQGVVCTVNAPMTT